MQKLWRDLKNQCEHIFNAHDSVCLWFSGGSDSRLLLEYLLENNYKFDLITMTDGWSAEQHRYIDKIIIEKGVTVYSYKPFHAQMNANADKSEIAFEFFYKVNQNHLVKIIKDAVKGNKCAYDMPTFTNDEFVLRFDAHITGLRKFDTHFLNNFQPFITKKIWKEGDCWFYAPLFDWEKKQIHSQLRKRKIEILENEQLDTGNISVCVECFKDKEVFCPKTEQLISPVVW